MQQAAGSLLPAHLPEEVHHTGEHDQEDTTSGTQSEHLGGESLVQRAEPFLLEDRCDGGPGPVVLGHLARNLGAVLDARLDDVHGRVDHGTGDTTDGTSDEVVAGLLRLVTRLGLGQLRAHLEDAAEVAAIPEDVAPQGGLETVVQGEGTLRGDNLLHHVQHAVVLARGGAVLQTDLDQLEGHHDEGLCGSGRRARQDRERLRLLLHAEELPVEGAPAVVGGEFGRALGGLHEDGGADAAVETGESVSPSLSMSLIVE